MSAEVKGEKTVPLFETSASADLIATNEPGDDVPAHVAKSEQRHEPAQLVSHFLCTVFVVHVVAN